MQSKTGFVCLNVIKWIAPLAMLCIVLASPELALAATCTAGNPAQQMSCLRMENAVLGERLARATLLKSIAKQSTTTTVKSTRKLGFPSVLSTYGINGKMNAVLVWTRHGENVGSMITHAGSAIPDGWHVTQISNGTVVVQKGSKSRTLLLSNGATSSQQLSLPFTRGSAVGAGYNSGTTTNIDGAANESSSTTYGVHNLPAVSAPINGIVR